MPFLQAISKDTCLYGCRLTLESAHREAVFLLNHFYQGLHHPGLDGALDDASNPDYDGLAVVLARLTAAMKDYWRQKHLSRVKYRYLDAVDWRTKHIMLQLLLARSPIPLEPPLSNWSLQQLSGSLLRLVELARPT